jgi:hypothetical protein
VRIIIYFHMIYFWINNNHIRISIILFHFCLTISKCSWNGKSSRYNSNRPLSNRPSRTCKHYIIILINISTSFDNSFSFGFFRWFVIKSNWCKFLTLIWWNYSSWISCIGKPCIIINNKYNDCTWSWFISNLYLILFHKCFLCFFESLKQCFFWIWWEAILICNNIVQIIS